MHKELLSYIGNSVITCKEKDEIYTLHGSRVSKIRLKHFREICNLYNSRVKHQTYSRQFSLSSQLSRRPHETCTSFWPYAPIQKVGFFHVPASAKSLHSALCYGFHSQGNDRFACALLSPLRQLSTGVDVRVYPDVKSAQWGGGKNL
jgi:hypothetical protein